MDYIKKVNSGSFYTPPHIVELVYQFVTPYIDSEAVIMDNSCGDGAFVGLFDVSKNKAERTIFADNDSDVVNALCENNINALCDNSLFNVSRSKYGIEDNRKLIIVGNPPYNDVTSKNKHSIKNEVPPPVDNDIKSRDLGLSFLKSYDKLRADVVCILHPLSYLIKRTNFNSLKAFKNNYKLIKATIFSSAEFALTKKTSFPVVVALYERNANGMDFDYIHNFSFDILGDTRKLVLAKTPTIDGVINKYPPRKNDNPVSDIGVYFYQMRDINALMTSQTFANKATKSHIVVNLCDLYKYCYLDVFKHFFKNDYIFGNLSPLLPQDGLDSDSEFARICVRWTICNNKALKNTLTDSEKLQKVLEWYQIESIDSKDDNEYLKQYFCDMLQNS